MSDRPWGITKRSRLRTLGFATLLAAAIGLVYAAFALAAPPNDNLAAATPLVGNTVDAMGNNMGATKEPGEPDHALNPGGHSVWWVWTAPERGVATIDTCASTFDTLLAVYTVRPDQSLHAVRANDDSASCANGTRSRLEFTANEGVEYRIAVDGAGGVTGHITLALREVAINDSFAKAIRISGRDTDAIGDNSNATSEPGEPEHGFAPDGGASLWYRWVAPGSGTTRVSTCESGTDFDTSLGVYQGSTVDALDDVAPGNDDDINEDGFCEVESRLFFDATKGEVYWLAVDGESGERGHFVASLRILDDPSLEVELKRGGTGRVTSSPPGINCGNGRTACSRHYEPGTVVALTAHPADDSVFDRWAGDCSGTGPCEVRLDWRSSVRPYHVDALFRPKVRKPDAQIKLKSDAGFLGDGVYNSSGASQTSTGTAGPGKARAYVFKIGNDGNDLDTFKVKGCAASAGFTVSYANNGADITAAVQTGTQQFSTVAPGDERTMSVTIASQPGTANGATMSCAIKATSVGDPAKSDTVLARLTVGP